MGPIFQGKPRVSRKQLNAAPLPSEQHSHSYLLCPSIIIKRRRLLPPGTYWAAPKRACQKGEKHPNQPKKRKNQHPTTKQKPLSHAVKSPNQPKHRSYEFSLSSSMPVLAGQQGRAGRAQCLSAGTLSHTGTQPCPRVLPSRLPRDKHILRPRRLRNALSQGKVQRPVYRAG